MFFALVVRQFFMCVSLFSYLFWSQFWERLGWFLVLLGIAFWILGRVALKMLFRERFGRFLEANLAPSWGPSWSQVAIKITFEVGHFFDPVSERNLQHLGLGFGRLWGAKMESKSELKIRRSKT